jgi:hypothetical protein
MLRRSTLAVSPTVNDILPDVVKSRLAVRV